MCLCLMSLLPTTKVIWRRVIALSLIQQNVKPGIEPRQLVYKASGLFTASQGLLEKNGMTLMGACLFCLY